MDKPWTWGWNGDTCAVWGRAIVLGESKAEREQRARLIAAAPRLLAECEENSAVLMALLAHLNGVANEKVCASIRERISATEDAIAKATGEQA